MATTQPLAFPIRLPDALQDEALRRLDASRQATNELLVELWPALDRFAAERTGPAWKQVEQYATRRSGHGSRQERGEMEQAGRILRAQASRKQVFQTILPLLSAGLIRPADGKRPAKKDYRQIREQVRALRVQQQEAGEEADAFVAMTNLIEQACNYYLETGAFPTTYEELQTIPVQKAGQLTFAGDDGMHAGQTYRARLSVAQSCDRSTRAEARRASLALKLRAPDLRGTWAWGAWSAEMPLPAFVCAYLEHGATPLAPTLREIVRPDGRRVAVLDLILEVPTSKVPPRAQERRVLGFDWGVRSLITASVVEPRPGQQRVRQVSRPVFLDTGGIDGRQARLRREIDRLKACREHYAALCTAALAASTEQQTTLPADLARWQARVRDYEERIGTCWQKYARRTRELAHLAANLLILLALLSDCHLICGENLATLRTQGRGRGVRGRWRHWRTNTTVRGELWRVLSYKCMLLGIRARQVEPRGTTHTCPHCHQPARTFASSAPADRKQALDWGPWLCCENPECLWNGARDYAASLNIARLGLALFLTARQRIPSWSSTLTSLKVKPALYSRAGATLLLPSQGITPRPREGKHVCYAGWSFSLALRTSRPTGLVAVLSTAHLRKRVLEQSVLRAELHAVATVIIESSALVTKGAGVVVQKDATPSYKNS